nr:transposase [Enhygromyxa salina]
MPRKKRRTFTPQQKAEAVKICQRSSKPIAQVARDLDLPEGALRNWVNQAKVDEGGTSDAGPLTTEEREELKQLRRQNRELQMERDFLKKAAAFVCHERDQ